jgi:hypothetical protein
MGDTIDNRKKLILDSITIIYKNYLINTLKYINSKYPKLFPKSKLLSEITKISMKRVPFSENTKTKLKKRVIEKIQIKKQRNTGYYIQSTKKRKIAIDDDLRCMARLWGNGYITIQKCNLVYGIRCNNEIKHGISSKYCGIHLRNKNKHGDFNKEPTIEIKNEYEKHSKIYKKFVSNNK